MKKLICIAMVLLLAVSASACGKTEKKEEKKSDVINVTDYSSVEFDGYEKSQDSDNTIYKGKEWVDNTLTQIIVKPDFGENAGYTAKISKTGVDFTTKLEKCTVQNADNYIEKLQEKGFKNDDLNTPVNTENVNITYLVKDKATAFIYLVKASGNLQISLTIN